MTGHRSVAGLINQLPLRVNVDSGLRRRQNARLERVSIRFNQIDAL